MYIVRCTLYSIVCIILSMFQTRSFLCFVLTSTHIHLHTTYTIKIYCLIVIILPYHHYIWALSIQRINACLRCNETEMKLREKSISFKCYYIIENTHTHAIPPKTLSFILRNGISNIFLSFHIPSVLRYCLMNYKLCLLVLNSICCCHVIIPPDM